MTKKLVLTQASTAIFTVATLTTAFVLGATSMQAFAMDKAAQDGQAPLSTEFRKLDVNGNNLLGRTEARKDKLFTKSNFVKADTDKDGTLNQDEYANFKSATQQKVVKRVVSDSVITSKAKAEILGTKGLKSLQISVETSGGEVILSGFVDNEAAKVKAEEVVTKIEGVKSVKNSLEVKA